MAATGLQARALSYSNDQLNDGHLTAADLVRIAPEARQKDRAKLAAELVARGIWEAELAGWYIHDFPVYNKLRVQVEAERAHAAERMANVRANKSRTGPERAATVREPFNDPVPVPKPVPKDQDPNLELPRRENRGGPEAERDEQNPAPGLSAVQDGLRHGLVELDPVWETLTFGGINKLNRRFGRPIVVMALQRAREEQAIPADPFPWLQAICLEIETKATVSP